MSTIKIRFIAGLSFLALLALAQTVPAGPGQGWMGEFEHASRQINALAEAVPAEKYAWRPSPGVRSVAEVYMHIALGNYFLLAQAGIKLPPEIAAKLKADGEKSVTGKADVIKWLNESQNAVRENYSKADRQRKTKFFGNETNVDGIFLRLLVHNHEHMGQSIAYARMIGVKPPWSQGAGQE
jgi:uncharacterized damage-inducible protein DinB